MDGGDFTKQEHIWVCYRGSSVMLRQDGDVLYDRGVPIIDRAQRKVFRGPPYTADAGNARAVAKVALRGDYKLLYPMRLHPT